MAYRECELGLLVRLDEKRAGVRIMRAYRRSKGNTTKAAERLSVDRATLKRWVRRLALRDDIDAIRSDAAA